MTHEEAQALASIARRLLRDGHISSIEASFMQALITKVTPPRERAANGHIETEPIPDE